MTAVISSLPCHLRPVMLSSLCEEEISHGPEKPDSGELHRIISSHFGDDRFVMGLRQIYSVSKGNSDSQEALALIMGTRIYSVSDLRRIVRGKQQAWSVRTRA